MTHNRPIDRWFIDEILPYEQQYLKVARRLTNSAEEAADLVQEAYCRLFESSGWAAALDPKAYTVRTIRNLALSHMRRARIVEFRQLVEADWSDLPDDRPDAFQVAAGREALDRTVKALDDMPERCRAALLHCRVEEQTPRSAAATLGLSLSTLEKRLARGLKLLAAALYPQDVDDPQEKPGELPSRATGYGQDGNIVAYDRRYASGPADK